MSEESWWYVTANSLRYCQYRLLFSVIQSMLVLYSNSFLLGNVSDIRNVVQSTKKKRMRLSHPPKGVQILSIDSSVSQIMTTILCPTIQINERKRMFAAITITGKITLFFHWVSPFHCILFNLMTLVLKSLNIKEHLPMDGETSLFSVIHLSLCLDYFALIRQGVLG